MGRSMEHSLFIVGLIANLATCTAAFNLSHKEASPKCACRTVFVFGFWEGAGDWHGTNRWDVSCDIL